MRGMRGLERESIETLLWDRLDAIRIPILLIGGGAEGALLKQEHVEKYRQHCRNLEVAIFPDSGHMIWQPDYNRFISRVNKFLDHVDNPRGREIPGPQPQAWFPVPTGSNLRRTSSFPVSQV